MKETDFEFTISSDLDYEDLIADIGFGNQLVALLTQEAGFENLRVQIYPPNEGGNWNFRLDEFEKIIQQAKGRLWELRKISEESEE